jgi:dienelactone hydrolase
MARRKPVSALPPGSAAPAVGLKTARPAQHLRLSSGIARATLALLFGVGFALSVIPAGRTVARAALLLPAIVAATQPAPLILAGAPIRHTQLTIPSRGGTVYLDVYAPITSPPPVPGAREGVVMISGVGDNRAVPQFVNLSEALARAGVVVMDMTTPTLLAYDLAPVDGDAVVQAFERLARWPGVGADRIGIIGFSAGGPLACLAAADPRIRDRVAFVTLFGSYFKASDLLRDFGRRALVVDGHVQLWQPDEVSVQVLANIIAGVLPSWEGAAIVNAVAPGGTPLTPAELAWFSPAAAAAYHLLVGDEPARVNTNLAALSPQMRKLLAALSPSTVVARIRAPVYLLHDRNDHYVPFTESEDFAAALARLGHPHDFVEFGIFQHVEVRSGLSVSQLLGDGPRLFRVLYESLLVGG